MTDALNEMNETILDKLTRAVDYHPDDDDNTDFVDMDISFMDTEAYKQMLNEFGEAEGIGDA